MSAEMDYQSMLAVALAEARTGLPCNSGASTYAAPLRRR